MRRHRHGLRSRHRRVARLLPLLPDAMNLHEHLLTVLAEELGEAQKEIHKALRFGIDDRKTLDPKVINTDPNEPTNRDKIMAELNDVLSLCEMLRRQNILPNLPSWNEAKIRKVGRYAGYARMVGSLIDSTP